MVTDYSLKKNLGMYEIDWLSAQFHEFIKQPWYTLERMCSV